MNDRRHNITWGFGVLLVMALTFPAIFTLSGRIDVLDAKVVVLERNAAIDAIPDAELMENPDYYTELTKTVDGQVYILDTAVRSTQWPKSQRAHLKKEWWCRGCSTTNKLQVHHITPFHVDPSRELDDANMITLCMWSNRCHLVKGHLGNFKLYNTNIVLIATNGVAR